VRKKVELQNAKRKTVKRLIAGTAISGTVVTQGKWIEPTINSIVLPAHAVTSEVAGGGAAVDPPSPPPPDPVEPVTIQLQCTVTNGTLVNFPGAVNTGFSVQATLISGPADTSLAGIPIVANIDFEGVPATIAGQFLGPDGPPVTASSGPFSGVTDASGSFNNPSVEFSVPRNYGGSGRRSSFVLTLSSSDPRVTSTGAVCSCAKTDPANAEGQPAPFVMGNGPFVAPYVCS